MATRGRPAVDVVAHLRPSGNSQDAVLAELRRVLASGRVRPGTLLPLDGIAKAFGVSRTPVREALKTLLGEGLIRHSHRGGYIVHALTRAEFVELYTIRAALETSALALAVPQATADDREAVAASLAVQRGALDGDDIATWDTEGRAFHAAMVAPCRMPRLSTLIRDAANSTGTTRPMMRLSLARIEQLHADHVGLAEAFLAGDTDACTAAAADHMNRVRDWLLETFDPPGIYPTDTPA